MVAGAIGLKADFWVSDHQQTIEATKALFEEAAARHLVVNLHGSTLPRGWHRTWPNFLTAESVLGAESYLYESNFSTRAAELHTVLPFTRNVMGPMDYTPLALSAKRYPRTTTAAHELATALLFTSGLIHYAEGPSKIATLPPEAKKVLRDAPARWDETRCLIGEPGRKVVFARRAGSSWFLVGVNGLNEPQSVSLPMDAFLSHPHWTLLAEGEEAINTISAEAVALTELWSHTMPARGGWILRLDGGPTFDQGRDGRLLKLVLDPESPGTGLLRFATEQGVLYSIRSRIDLVEPFTEKDEIGSVLGDGTIQEFGLQLSDSKRFFAITPPSPADL